MKDQITELVTSAIESLRGQIPPEAVPQSVEIERTRDPRHGDFACNVALKMAKPARRTPRELAEAIAGAIPESPLLDRVEIAGPGFINFTLSPAAFQGEVARILDRAESYGRSDLGAGSAVLVEFVSANPTGPLHVGHGRHAAYGATIADLLAAVGYRVGREYYVNDAGRQTDILAVCVWLRYLELCGEHIEFPANGYRGEYVNDIAVKLQGRVGEQLHHTAESVYGCLPPDEPGGGDREVHLDALIARTRLLLGEQALREVLDVALEAILADIRDDLAGFGIQPDTWFSERSLAESGAIGRALERLREHNRVYEKDGALWFRATDYGDEKDRVVVRENGQTTYFASDIAYHLHKRERGNDLLLTVLGADHHGYVARVRAGLEAMGEPPDSLEVRLVQFVTLLRGGEKAQMSTRLGKFVTLRELRSEVGDDAARFFYVMRSNDQHLPFDLELAKSRSQDNPVYYIQYAHARVCSVLRQLAQRELQWDEARGRRGLARLEERHEQTLMSTLSRYPEIIESAALNRAPHTLVHYLRDLANDFHTYYNAHTFLVDDEVLRDARLALIIATRQVIHNGLSLLGVSAPESM